MKRSIGVSPEQDFRHQQDLNPPVYYFLRSKIFRQVTQVQIRIPGSSLSRGSLQCRWWDSKVEFRIVLEHLWKKFFNPRFTFIHAYNVHCNTYILGPVFIYFLLDSGGGRGHTKHLPPAHNRRILNLEAVTLHRRSDSKRAYRPQAFF
jgi:hypothetical protein